MEIIVKEQPESIFRSKLPNIDIPDESPATSLLTMEITMNEQQEYIFRSKLPDIDIPNESFPLHSYLFENLSKVSARPCLINASTGKMYSYADVDLISRKLAAGLHKQGIHQGDVIMIALHNSPEFVFSFLGASRIGAIATTVNPFHLPDDIQKQAQASNSKLIITSSNYAVKVKDFASANSIKIICTDDVNFSELCQTDENGLPEVKIEPEDTVVLPYSSGTTGLPKAVLLTHKSLITSVAQHVDGETPNVYFHDKDIIMVVLPLFHLYSMCTVMMCGLRAGSALLLMEKFEINTFVELIEKYKVTILPSVSPILSAIVDSPVAEKCDLTSVRMVMSAATPLGKKLVGAVNDKLPNAKIGQVYGMTEASVMTICMSLAKEATEWKFGSCGNVVRNGELKVVDPITRISLPRNQNGEICFRSHQLTKGYLNNKEATEETIDKDGWLMTGDIGYMDEDDELFVVDRIKELIKYKGYQVAPAEIENILRAHPHISDAAVVPMKDELSGEIPVAFVVLATDSTVSEEDIKQHVSKQVVFYKRIHRVIFVDSIPKASSGKILRKELKEKLVSDILS